MKATTRIHRFTGIELIKGHVIAKCRRESHGVVINVGFVVGLVSRQNSARAINAVTKQSREKLTQSAYATYL